MSTPKNNDITRISQADNKPGGIDSRRNRKLFRREGRKRLDSKRLRDRASRREWSICDQVWSIDDRRAWVDSEHTIQRSALDPTPVTGGHSDSFKPAERRIKDGGDWRRRRDRAIRSYKRKLKRDTRNMICGAYDDRCTHAPPNRPHM